MEFGLREYLLILGALLIVGLLADGIRRTIKHKRDGLKLDLMAAPPASPEKTDVSPKRPVKRATAAELEPQVNTDPLFDSDDQSQLNLWAGEIKPETMKGTEFVSEDDAASVSTEPERTDPLFELSETTETQSETDQSSEVAEVPEGPEVSETPVRHEPTFDGISNQDGPDIEMPESDAATAPIESADASHAEDMRVLTEGPMDAPMQPEHQGSGLGAMMSRMLARLSAQRDVNSDHVLPEAPVFSPEHSVDQEPPSDTEPEADATAVLDDLVLVQLMPTRAERFVDVDLHRAALRAGLRRTPQNWYQRYPLDQATTPLYSLVNGIEPGVFESDARALNTPMLLLFTELSPQPDPVFAVNELISGARAIAREIGGDVFDTNGQPISKEWIDVARARAGQTRLLQS